MPPTHTDEGLRAAIAIRQRGRRSASWCCRSTSRSATPATAGRETRDRIPAEGPGRRCRRVPRGSAPGRRRRHGARPGGRLPLLARARRRDPLERLTPREREVLALMAEGRSNRRSRAARRDRQGRGEAREQHLHQARPAAGRGRPPPRAGGPAMGEELSMTVQTPLPPPPSGAAPVSPPCDNNRRPGATGACASCG